MKLRTPLCGIVDILFLLILVLLAPFQYAVAQWGTPSYVLCILYSAVTLVGFTYLCYKRRDALNRLSRDKETGFFSRSSFDVAALPDDITYMLYIKLPNLDDLLTRFGLEAEQEAIEKLSQFILYAFTDITENLYRYGDQSLVAYTTSSETLNELVSKLSAAVRRVSQYSIPFPQYSYELRPVLQVGVLPIAPDISKSKYIEYARFPLSSIETSLDPSVRIFDQEQFDEYRATYIRQAHIPDIIYNEDVAIVFQPIMSCHTCRLIGYEALTRPVGGTFKHIGELLSDAEEAGLYINLETCLTHAAIRTFKEKRTQEDTRLFVNFAPAAIRSEAYAFSFTAGLLRDVPMVLEIVERGEVLPDIVRRLRAVASNVNAAVALDDFGTGYSNHLALLNARPDIIKVSRELLTDIDTDVAKQQIYSNIVMFARNLNTEILAEGVETEEEFQTLLRLGMDYAQGYFIGKPHSDLLDVSERSKFLCDQYNNL